MPSIDNFEYLSSKYNHFITPSKVFAQLPAFFPERYLKIIEDDQSCYKYEDSLELLRNHRYDEIIISCEEQIEYLKSKKDTVKLDNSEPIILYKINLINNLIGLFL